MGQLQLSKSDFLAYRQCAKSLWLRKRKPDAVSWPPPNLFDQFLMRDGYRVEEVVKQLVATWPDADRCQFQATFQSGDGLYARADMVRDLDDGRIDIFEIKASTSLKSSTGQDHIDDVAFQQLVAERAGHTIRSVYVIHVRKDYVRRGAIDPASFLASVDVTLEAQSRKQSIARDADAALKLLAMNEIDERGCSCRRIGSQDSQCASFAYFNPDVPSKSVYLLPRISKSRLETFLSEGRLGLDEIDPSELTPSQVPVLLAAQRGEPIVNADEIARFVHGLTWPLHFYDYETFASAIPISDGLTPQQQVPVQYSLHKLHEDGRLEHFECLTKQPGAQIELVNQMRRDFGDRGSLVAWNMSFEKGCNTRLAALVPHSAAFYMNLNDRTVDLMDVFKSAYVDIEFRGSTSIKKVLPIICPHLKYDKNAVHDGGGAMAAWLTMIETQDPSEQEKLGRELRAYCHLDSLAMVEIFRFLQALV